MVNKPLIRPYFGGGGVALGGVARIPMIIISLIWPPPCNSDHQNYYIFSGGFLLTFTFHCYREVAISK